jgi:Zn-dependent peptidase ImmA (M78 family)
MEFVQLSHDDIEKEAKHFLDTFFADRDTPHVLPIPIESIAEHYLGYDIEISDEGVFANPLVLGGIMFDEKKIMVNAATESHEGRYSFTLAHEVGHHVLHKAIFEAAHNNQMVCREDANKPIEERQADHFAGALLMPEDRMRQLYSDLKIPKRQYSGKAMKAVARRVMTAGGFSNVSNQAMIVRLRQLGLTKETKVQLIYRRLLQFIR